MKIFGKYSRIHTGYYTKSNLRTYTSLVLFMVDGILYLPMYTNLTKNNFSLFTVFKGTIHHQPYTGVRFTIHHSLFTVVFT